MGKEKIESSSVICSVIKKVIKEENKNESCKYILKDCNGKEIFSTVASPKNNDGGYTLEFSGWKEEKYVIHLNADDEKEQVFIDGELQPDINVNIGDFLTEKTKRYVNKFKTSEQNCDAQLSDEEKTKNNQYRVWILRIKTGSKDKYINIASSKDIQDEINQHIKDLLYTGSSKTTKTRAKTYQNLWERTTEVVFEEIFVDEYIKKNVEEEDLDPYLYSLIKPSKLPVEDLMESILSKLRAQYVEGRLAGEKSMASEDQVKKSGAKCVGGIWNEGTGIDGEVYNMYYKK